MRGQAVCVHVSLAACIWLQAKQLASCIQGAHTAAHPSTTEAVAAALQGTEPYK